MRRGALYAKPIVLVGHQPKVEHVQPIKFGLVLVELQTKTFAVFPELDPLFLFIALGPISVVAEAVERVVKVRCVYRVSFLSFKDVKTNFLPDV